MKASSKRNRFDVRHFKSADLTADFFGESLKKWSETFPWVLSNLTCRQILWLYGMTVQLILWEFHCML